METGVCNQHFWQFIPLSDGCLRSLTGKSDNSISLSFRHCEGLKCLHLCWLSSSSFFFFGIHYLLLLLLAFITTATKKKKKKIQINCSFLFSEHIEKDAAQTHTSCTGFNFITETVVKYLNTWNQMELIFANVWSLLRIKYKTVLDGYLMRYLW